MESATILHGSLYALCIAVLVRVGGRVREDAETSSLPRKCEISQGLGALKSHAICRVRLCVMAAIRFGILLAFRIIKKILKIVPHSSFAVIFGMKIHAPIIVMCRIMTQL